MMQLFSSYLASFSFNKKVEITKAMPIKPPENNNSDKKMGRKTCYAMTPSRLKTLDNLEKIPK